MRNPLFSGTFRSVAEPEVTNRNLRGEKVARASPVC
nr:MAG TPA: hypothetical protein [Caudoviricetes sp.]